MSYLGDVERSVRRYDPGDRELLREFQKVHFGELSRQRDDAFFHWLFERNPHRDPEGSALWLCKRDGRIVGQQGAIPTVLKVGEREYRASWGIDLMVDPEWRLKGVAPALSTAYQHSTDIALGMGLSEAAHRTFLRRGWIDMGKLPFFVRALDPQACARATRLSNGLAKRLPGFLVSGSARVAGGVAGALTGLSLQSTPAFDDRIDHVWRTSSRDYAVLAKRDWATLRWRFDEIPCSATYERYFLMRRSEVVGYAVLRMDELRGERIVRLIDYLSPRRWLMPLLALVFAESNKRGAAAVFIEQLHSRSEPFLRALGCLRLAESAQFMLQAAPSANGASDVLREGSVWFVSPADSDFDHSAWTPSAPVTAPASHPEMVS